MFFVYLIIGSFFPGSKKFQSCGNIANGLIIPFSVCLPGTPVASLIFVESEFLLVLRRRRRKEKILTRLRRNERKMVFFCIIWENRSAYVSAYIML